MQKYSKHCVKKQSTVTPLVLLSQRQLNKPKTILDLVEPGLGELAKSAAISGGDGRKHLFARCA